MTEVYADANPLDTIIAATAAMDDIHNVLANGTYRDSDHYEELISRLSHYELIVSELT